MGLTGALVGERDGRWQVRLDDGKGDKLLKPANLAIIGASAASNQPPSRPAANVAHSIVGSWTKWLPQKMTWNSGRGCYISNLDLGRSSVESFQILEEDDWAKTLHPDR